MGAGAPEFDRDGSGPWDGQGGDGPRGSALINGPVGKVGEAAAGYFCFREVRAPGRPVLLDATGQAGPIGEEPAEYDWRWLPPGRPPAPLPVGLRLVWNDQGYSFDLRAHAGGYLVSGRLLDLIDRFAPDAFERVPVLAVTSRGEPVSPERYAFIRCRPEARLSGVVDRDGSVVHRWPDGRLRRISRLALLPGIDRHVFQLSDRPLDRVLFCSAAFRAAFAAERWRGVELVDAAHAALARRL